MLHIQWTINLAEQHLEDKQEALQRRTKVMEEHQEGIMVETQEENTLKWLITILTTTTIWEILMEILPDKAQ